MSTTLLSVVICTHHRGGESLGRCLEALRQQTLPCNDWDLLVIDNNSPIPVPAEWLQWHPRARLLAESEPGLNAARRRALSEVQADLVLFVDDDNLLDADYLQQVLSLAQRHPNLGAFGGWATAVYEREPEPHLRARADAVALNHRLQSERWGNGHVMECLPFGAGMVIRREVARYHLKRLESDPRLRGFGRSGELNLFCEDTDLAWCAVDLGLGCGRFPALHFRHLIPASRVERGYLLKVAEGWAFSWLMLHRVRGLDHPELQPLRGWWHWLRQARRWLALSASEREFEAAHRRGLNRARSLPLESLAPSSKA